jgi:WD40 repeat protein
MQRNIFSIVLLLLATAYTSYAQTGRIVVPTAHDDKILKIVIDEQNKYFYTADEWKIIMWDFKTNKQLYTFPIANKSTTEEFGNTIHNLRFLNISPDGNVLAFTSEKNELKIFSTKTGKQISTVANVSSNFVFSKDSKSIYDLVRGPTESNGVTSAGRMARKIDINNGSVQDHWHLKDLNIWGALIQYFFPLSNAQVINFDEKGYQVLDMDEKKEIIYVDMNAQLKKDYDYIEDFNRNSLSVNAIPGLFTFQKHRKKEGLGYTVWDIYKNKPYAFVSNDRNVEMQYSFNSQNFFYSTKSNRFDNQDAIIITKDNKTLKKVNITGSDEINLAALSNKGNTIVYCGNDNKLYKFDLDKKDKELIPGVMPRMALASVDRVGDTLTFNGETVSYDKKREFTAHNYSANYVVDLSRMVVKIADTLPVKPSKEMNSLRINQDSFLLHYDNGDVDEYIMYNKKRRTSTPFTIKGFQGDMATKFGEFPGIPEFFFSNKNKAAYCLTAAVAGDLYLYTLSKYNLATKQMQKIFSSPEITSEEWNQRDGFLERPYTKDALVLDRENEILAAAEYNYRGSVRIIDLATGKILATHPFLYDSAAYRKVRVNPFYITQIKKVNNETVKVLGKERIFEMNLTNGSSKELKFADPAFFADKRNVEMYGDNKLETIIATYDTDKGTMAKTVLGPNQFELDHLNSPVKRIEFSTNDSILYTIQADKTINAYNAKTGKFYGTLYTFENSDDWVFIGADGRFDGTDNGMKQLYYLKGREAINIDKVFEKYYTPNLFKRLLNGEPFSPIPELDFKPKPTSKILYAEAKRNLGVEEDKPAYINTTGVAEITVNATAPEDKVDEIRLFHNGKVITLATRGMFVTDNDGSDSKKYTINLLPGTNAFRAVALNSQRTESDADEVTVTYGQAGGTPAPSPKPVNGQPPVKIDMVDRNATLHLVIVGINQYQNPKMNLNYAIADATALKDELEKDAKTVLGSVKTYFVTDANATTEGIQGAFKQVQSTARASDVFVFYYAGHGVVSNKNKEFYLVPNNVSNLSNVDAELAEKGIASKLLQQYAIDIPAQKQVFILDACQSAGAFEQMLQQNGDQQKSLALVARSTGTHWLAASGSQQYANEFSQLGHGAFTYVLLNALKGEAAAEKMITVYGLRIFLQNKVPELLKKYGGTPQYPASYGFGNDFPVEVLK